MAIVPAAPAIAGAAVEARPSAEKQATGSIEIALSGRVRVRISGRKAWLFCGSDRGGKRAAVMYGPIGTAKLDEVDPQACLADGLARIADQPLRRLHELLPWNWQPATAAAPA